MSFKQTGGMLVSMLVGIAFLNTPSAAAGSNKLCLYNPEGTCMDILSYNCPAGYKVSSRGCGFKEICCYPHVESVPTFNYGNTSCGISSKNANSKIVGGSATTVTDYPWMASIQKRGQPICGGSIIAENWILTAAHCVSSGTEELSVVVGSTKSTPGWRSYTKRHYVANILSHGRFDQHHKKAGFDIALIKLERAIDIGATMTRSVCLPEKDESFAENVCVIAGWGYTHEPVGVATSSGGSPRLRKANIPILNQALCTYYLPGMALNNICAGYWAGGVDSCQGDSGGPMVCQGKDGVWKQAGIVSYGNGCGRKRSMGVYTDVAQYSHWIDYIIANY